MNRRFERQILLLGEQKIKDGNRKFLLGGEAYWGVGKSGGKMEWALLHVHSTRNIVGFQTHLSLVTNWMSSAQIVCDGPEEKV